jgi:hypothetical protein
VNVGPLFVSSRFHARIVPQTQGEPHERFVSTDHYRLHPLRPRVPARAHAGEDAVRVRTQGHRRGAAGERPAGLRLVAGGRLAGCEGAPATTAAGTELGPPNPQTAPQQILELPEEAIFVLKDFGCYLNSRTFTYFDIVIGWLSEIRDVLAHTGRTVIFVGVDFDIPPALAHDITTIEFKLPEDAAIEKAVRFIGEDHPIDEAAMPSIITACRGMTQQQVEDRTALALRKFKKLNGEAARLILNEKAEVIRRTGMLDYRDPPRGGLDIIGGWDNVKKHVQLDKPCFTPRRASSASSFPRGLLLVGISGGGKTQMSLCIASFLNLPLIQMDVGSLMSKWVGESERNMRDAIRLLEGLGSCVLQLDEIEKGFGGVGGEMDGGAAQRSFGIFLKWLSDRSARCTWWRRPTTSRPCRWSLRVRAGSMSCTVSTCPRTRNARRFSGFT